MKALVLMVALMTVKHSGKKYVPDTDEDQFSCTEDEAVKLESIGAAKRVDNSDTELEDPLMKKTIKDLKALAEDRKVVIPDGITRKEDIVAFLNSDEGKGEV